MMNFKTLTLVLLIAMLCSPGLEAIKRKADDNLQDHTKRQRTEDKELCTIVCSNGEIKASYDLIKQCKTINNFISMKFTPQLEISKDTLAITFECLKSIMHFESSNQDIATSLQTFFTQKNLDDNERMNILKTAQYLQCNVLSNAINAILHDQERSRLNLGGVSFLECTELTSQEIDYMFGILNPSDQYQQTFCMASIQEINPSPFNYSYPSINNNQIDPRNIMSEFTGNQANYVPVQSPRNNDSNIDDINPNDIVLATIFINNVSNPSHDETNSFPVQSPHDSNSNDEDNSSLKKIKNNYRQKRHKKIPTQPKKIANSQKDQSVEDRPHKCTHEGCGKAFTQKGNLTKHQKTHTGEKPFKCTEEGCDYAAAQKSHLKDHQRIHMEEKPFKCTHEGCDYATAWKNCLANHMKSHTGDNPLICPHEGCDYATTWKQCLAKHIKTHKRVKPFKCPYEGSDKAFSQENNLNTHMKPSTADKPHKCTHPDCDRAFAQKSGLTRHQKTCKKRPT